MAHAMRVQVPLSALEKDRGTKVLRSFYFSVEEWWKFDATVARAGDTLKLFLICNDFPIAAFIRANTFQNACGL